MISFSSKITYMIVMLLAVITVTVIYNFSMYFIYTKKIPFFEQYRVNKDVKS